MGYFLPSARPTRTSPNALKRRRLQGSRRTSKHTHFGVKPSPNFSNLFFFPNTTDRRSPPTLVPAALRPSTRNTPVTMAPANLPSVLNATSQDIEMLLAAQSHLGSKNLQVHMEPYLWKTRADGVNVINIGKTWYVVVAWLPELLRRIGGREGDNC